MGNNGLNSIQGGGAIQGDMLTGVQSGQRDSKNAILGKYKSNASNEFMTSLGPTQGGSKMNPQMMTQLNGMNPMGMNPQMMAQMNPQMMAMNQMNQMNQMNEMGMGNRNMMGNNMAMGGNRNMGMGNMNMNNMGNMNMAMGGNMNMG